MGVCLLWMLCVVQVEASATGRSLVQGSPTDCVSQNVIRRNSNPLHLNIKLYLFFILQVHIAATLALVYFKKNGVKTKFN
jgi:hypothetical protein